jgi:hypothetical protein
LDIGSEQLDEQEEFINKICKNVFLGSFGKTFLESIRFEFLLRNRDFDQALSMVDSKELVPVHAVLGSLKILEMISTTHENLIAAFERAKFHRDLMLGNGCKGASLFCGAAAVHLSQKLDEVEPWITEKNKAKQWFTENRLMEETSLIPPRLKFLMDNFEM